MENKVSKYRGKLTDEQKADLVYAYRLGVSAKDIAKKFGVDPSTVHYHGFMAGIMRPRKTRGARA